MTTIRTRLDHCDEVTEEVRHPNGWVKEFRNGTNGAAAADETPV